jgi:pullulanase/glycogen debranching enzyme
VGFNAHSEPLQFTIPGELGRSWRVVIDTANHPVELVDPPDGTTFSIAAHSILVLERRPEPAKYSGRFKL